MTAFMSEADPAELIYKNNNKTKQNKRKKKRNFGYRNQERIVIK